MNIIKNFKAKVELKKLIKMVLEYKWCRTKNNRDFTTKNTGRRQSVAVEYTALTRKSLLVKSLNSIL